MDKLTKYITEARDFYEENKDSLDIYKPLLTNDEILLLCMLGKYLNDMNNKEVDLEIHKVTLESVRKLPKVERNTNYYFSWGIDSNKLKKIGGKEKKLKKSTMFLWETKDYCIGFSSSKSMVAKGKISDVIGHDFTLFYPCNYVIIK